MLSCMVQQHVDKLEVHGLIMFIKSFNKIVKLQPLLLLHKILEKVLLLLLVQQHKFNQSQLLYLVNQIHLLIKFYQLHKDQFKHKIL